MLSHFKQKHQNVKFYLFADLKEGTDYTY